MPVVNRHGFAHTVAFATVALGCLTATACSSGSASNSGGGGTVSNGASSNGGGGATSTADPLTGLSAQQVVNKAIADGKAAPSLKLAGTVSESGTSYTIDLSFKRGQGCTGTVGLAGKGSFAITIIGSTAYLKPDDKFWRSYAGAEASTVIALVNGRYLKGATSDPNVAGLAKICDVNQLLGGLKAQGTISKGTVTTLGGQRVLPINDSKGGTMYVTDTSTPQIAVVDNPTGTDKGKVNFTVGAPVTLTAPPASQVIDGSKIGF